MAQRSGRAHHAPRHGQGARWRRSESGWCEANRRLIGTPEELFEDLEAPSLPASKLDFGRTARPTSWWCLTRDERGSKQSKKKSPAHGRRRGFLEGPSLTLLASRRSLGEGYRGRSPDSWIILLANAFPAVRWPVACPVGVRPRSQRRVREGLAPSSRKRHLYSSAHQYYRGYNHVTQQMSSDFYLISQLF